MAHKKIVKLRKRKKVSTTKCPQTIHYKLKIIDYNRFVYLLVDDVIFVLSVRMFSTGGVATLRVINHSVELCIIL